MTRTGDLSAASSVNYAVVAGGTTAADDVGGVLPSGPLNFAAGQATATITVNVAGDTTVEPDETFSVQLSGAMGATLGTASASSTILNDDVPPPPVLSIATDQASKAEGNTGTTPFTFTVTRTGDLSAASSVNYAVVAGGTTAADYVGGVLPSGPLNFAAGQATATITVNVAGDTTVEPDETFSVQLSGAMGATLGTASASSTILNDDVPTACAVDRNRPGQQG